MALLEQQASVFAAEKSKKMSNENPEEISLDEEEEAAETKPKQRTGNLRSSTAAVYRAVVLFFSFFF